MDRTSMKQYLALGLLMSAGQVQAAGAHAKVQACITLDKAPANPLSVDFEVSQSSCLTQKGSPKSSVTVHGTSVVCADMGEIETSSSAGSGCATGSAQYDLAYIASTKSEHAAFSGAANTAWSTHVFKDNETASIQPVGHFAAICLGTGACDSGKKIEWSYKDDLPTVTINIFPDRTADDKAEPEPKPTEHKTTHASTHTASHEPTHTASHATEHKPTHAPTHASSHASAHTAHTESHSHSTTHSEHKPTGTSKPKGIGGHAKF